MGDVTVTEGVYSIEGQDQQANLLAFGTPNAPADDDSMTDGGVTVDTGEMWDEQGHALEPDVDPHQLAADRIRAEIETQQSAEGTAQWLEQHEQAEQETAYNDALENYKSLPPEEQFEVSLESVGRGLEAIAPVVNSEQAQVLNQELFAGGADAVPMATTLAFFASNVVDTLQSAGITDPSQLTPQVAQQLTDPAMATLFATNLCQALRMPELLADGIVDPMTMSATLLPHVPALLSGQSSDLYPRDYKLQFAKDLAVAFGQRQILRQIDPDAAVALFDQWAKWGGRLSAGLQYHRQQAQPQPSRAREREQSKPARNSKSNVPKMRTHTDLFDQEALERYSARL
jgi:hypothetical protein